MFTGCTTRGASHGNDTGGKSKAKCVAQLKAMGAVYFYPVTGGYGASGVSDIVVCYEGLYIAIECKAGKNKLSELQKMFLEKVAAAGGLGVGHQRE
jgi:VRR-NUC domain.